MLRISEHNLSGYCDGVVILLLAWAVWYLVHVQALCMCAFATVVLEPWVLVSWLTCPARACAV